MTDLAGRAIDEPIMWRCTLSKPLARRSSCSNQCLVCNMILLCFLRKLHPLHCCSFTPQPTCEPTPTHFTRSLLPCAAAPPFGLRCLTDLVPSLRHISPSTLSTPGRLCAPFETTSDGRPPCCTKRAAPSGKALQMRTRLHDAASSDPRGKRN